MFFIFTLYHLLTKRKNSFFKFLAVSTPPPPPAVGQLEASQNLFEKTSKADSEESEKH